jgi:Flp pilus assembly protein TadD
MSTPLMRKAASLHQAGQLAAAAQLYEQALRADPRDVDAIYSLGIIHLQSGRLEEAQSILAEALKMRPRFAEALCSRGIALMQLRRRDEALTTAATRSSRCASWRRRWPASTRRSR